jgi:hypothetical protein
MGVLVMLLQFIMTTILSTSLSFFWTLINSQINFIYMPLLSVNAPGQVSFYYEVLIYVCTFDPVPMDVMYEVIPIWSFNKVDLENERKVFGRIGLSDRNIISVLGSLILFITMVIVSQLIYQMLIQVKIYSHRIRKVIKYVTIESAYRTIIIIFFLETYLDLLLGGLVNTENDYLMDDPDNWGRRGQLTFSDQFAIIIGNIIYVGSLLFPFITIYILD